MSQWLQDLSFRIVTAPMAKDVQNTVEEKITRALAIWKGMLCPDTGLKNGSAKDCPVVRHCHMTAIQVIALKTALMLQHNVKVFSRCSGRLSKQLAARTPSETASPGHHRLRPRPLVGSHRHPSRWSFR